MNQRTVYRVLYYIMARLYLVVQTGQIEAVWGLTQFRVYKLSNFSIFMRLDISLCPEICIRNLSIQLDLVY